MRRRALLSAVAAGGLAGCLTGQPSPRVRGIDDRRVDTTHCGTLIGRPCGLAVGMRNSIDREIDIREQLGGVVTVYRATDRLVVRGQIVGIGDPSCREGGVSTVELSDGTLSVSVHDETDLSGGCEEDAGSVHYRVAVADEDGTIRRVRVTHYADDGDEILSGTVDVSPA